MGRVEVASDTLHSLGSLETRGTRAMVTAFLVSFGVIFVAELGDKSQLMALTFATRFRALPVLIGITAATALVHLAHYVEDRFKGKKEQTPQQLLGLPGSRPLALALA